jgi:hypothetical protein
LAETGALLRVTWRASASDFLIYLGAALFIYLLMRNSLVIGISERAARFLMNLPPPEIAFLERSGNFSGRFRPLFVFCARRCARPGTFVFVAQRGGSLCLLAAVMYAHEYTHDSDAHM